MRLPTLLCALSGLLCALPLSARTPAAPPKHRASGETYWSGHAAGVTYRWTDRDLTATLGADTEPTFSVVRALKREFGRPDADSGFTHYECSFLPLSAVGSLLSYERDDYWEGGAHPSGSETFVTVDVRSPQRRVRLTDLFSAAAIRQALLSDPVVQHVLTREKIAPPPTLEGLVKAIAGKEFGGENDSMYSFPDDLLSDFALHHVEQGRVAVRLLLPHGSEIFRFRHTQLGLLLPMPSGRAAAFSQAAAGGAGALMPALQRVARGRKSTLTLIDRSAPGL